MQYGVELTEGRCQVPNQLTRRRFFISGEGGGWGEQGKQDFFLTFFTTDRTRGTGATGETRFFNFFIPRIGPGEQGQQETPIGQEE